MDKIPEISVVLATKNRFHDIIKCIDSILDQTRLPDEIVIIDASDTQELNLKIKEFRSEKTKIIYVHTKPGMCYQRNIGIEKSYGDIVFILDDDTILEKNFIKEIVKIFEKDKYKKIGGVQGDVTNMLNYSGILDAIYIPIHTVLSEIFFLSTVGDGKFRLSGFQACPWGVNKVLKVDYLSGCTSAYRREVLNEFKFDENLHNMTDVDLSYRISRKYQNVYTPHAKLIHNVSPGGRATLFMRKKRRIQDHYYLFKKNIPQTFKHKFAFYMSIIGLFMVEMMNTLITRNAEGSRGLSAGLLDIKRKKRG